MSSKGLCRTPDTHAAKRGKLVTPQVMPRLRRSIDRSSPYVATSSCRPICVSHQQASPFSLFAKGLNPLAEEFRRITTAVAPQQQRSPVSGQCQASPNRYRRYGEGERCNCPHPCRLCSSAPDSDVTFNCVSTAAEAVLAASVDSPSHLNQWNTLGHLITLRHTAQCFLLLQSLTWQAQSKRQPTLLFHLSGAAHTPACSHQITSPPSFNHRQAQLWMTVRFKACLNLRQSTAQ